MAGSVLLSAAQPEVLDTLTEVLQTVARVEDRLGQHQECLDGTAEYIAIGTAHMRRLAKIAKPAARPCAPYAASGDADTKRSSLLIVDRAKATKRKVESCGDTLPELSRGARDLSEGVDHLEKHAQFTKPPGWLDELRSGGRPI